MPEGFQTFDHTGDLGLEVWAESPERLFALAAEALMRQIAEVPAGEPAEVQVQVHATGADAADLLVDWLNQALLQSELERAIWTHAAVDLPGPDALEGVLSGPRFDRRRHQALREVKAISHHGVELHLEPPNCRCRVILDI